MPHETHLKTHPFISAETLLVLFPDLSDDLATLPTLIRDGQLQYDAFAALAKTTPAPVAEPALSDEDDGRPNDGYEHH